MKKSIKDDNIRYNRDEALQRVSSFLEGAKIEGKKFEIAGSFRRGVETVGDIDIVALEVDVFWWHWFVGKIGGEPWAIGPRNMDFGLDGFPVNIRFFSPKEWGAGLLFLTGSKEFNILCRNKARMLGLTLNQYDLYDSEGNPLGLGRKEAWILEKLELMEYLDPITRGCDGIFV